MNALSLWCSFFATGFGRQPSVVHWTKIITREEEAIALKLYSGGWSLKRVLSLVTVSDFAIGCSEWLNEGGNISLLYQYFANLDNLADDTFLSPLTPLGQKILLHIVRTFSILPPFPSRKSFTEKRVLNAFYKYRTETCISLRTVCWSHLRSGEVT